MLRKLSAFVLGLALVLCSIPVSCEETETEILYRPLNAIFDTWYYVPDTVPEDITVQDWSQEMTLKLSGRENPSEPAVVTELTFISGDEFLRDAVIAEGSVLRVDNSKLVAPGRAIFHVRLESEHLSVDKDCTLRVFSYEERPAIGSAVPDPVFSCLVGDTFYAFSLLRSAAAFYYNQTVFEIRREEDSPYFTVTNFFSVQDIPEAFMDESSSTRFHALHEGSFPVICSFSQANIMKQFPVTLNICPFRITGPADVRQGGSAQYRTEDSDPGSGRTFALSARGEGITFDETSSTLTVAENAPENAPFFVTAVPSDGGCPFILKGRVVCGCLSNMILEPITLWNGFTAPAPYSQELKKAGAEDDYYNIEIGYDETALCDCTIRTFYTDVMAEDPEVAAAWYADNPNPLEESVYEVQESEMLDIDGHPARLSIVRVMMDDQQVEQGVIEYLRNNGFLSWSIYILPANGTVTEDLPEIAMTDLRSAAKQIVYNPSAATVTADAGMLDIFTEGNPAFVTPGTKLQFSCAHASPEKVKQLDEDLKRLDPSDRSLGCTGIEWSVYEAESGSQVRGISISKNGSLSVNPSDLTERIKIEVKVSSPFFHTSAVYPLTVTPAVRKLSADPEKVVLFAGTDACITVKAVPDPESAMLTGLSWSMKKEGIVELTPVSDAEAVLTPLAAGKTTLTLSEAGGKKATVNILVAEPVTDLELSLTGKQVPGGTVTVKAVTTPQKPDVPDLEWSLDVGEDIATVNARGQVKISKTAPAGTVITVTCRALGAPVPVVRTILITVDE